MAPPKTRHSRRPKKAPDCSSASGFLAEVDRLKHQAERRSEGASRESLLEQCAKLLEQAIASNLSLREEEEAFFDLGEVYTLWGNSVKAGMYTTLGNVFNGKLVKANALNLQLGALERSTNFYRKSHEMFEEIVSRASTELKMKAMINSANSLCDWADICSELPSSRGGGAAAAENLYMQADLRYSTALSDTPDDVELLTNFGDCKIKRAELAVRTSCGISAESESWVIAKDFYTKAMVAYGRACGLSDARMGDDLAGLLQNWGAGLLSLAARTTDSVEAAVTFELALEKLRTAAKFHPTDVSIFLAIGEACCTRAEQLGKMQALESILHGIDDGFSTALKINATCLDAIIGKGEAHMALGKLAASLGKHSLSQEHFILSLNTYMKALEVLKSDVTNESKLKFEEQSDVLFNLSCVAAICDQDIVCADALTLLIQIDGISPSELYEDSDLQSLMTKEWFQALLNKGG